MFSLLIYLIIVCLYFQLSKLSWLGFLWAPVLSVCTTLYWICVSRRDDWCHLLGVLLCSSYIWISRNMVSLALSPARGGCFGVCSIVPSYIAVMFKLVRPTIFRASCFVYSTYEGSMPPFPVVSALLKDTWVYVYAPNSSNVLTYIDVSVNDWLSFNSHCKSSISKSPI